MLRIVLTVLYTGLALGANAAQADVAAAQTALAGEMRKLVFHDTAKALPDEGLSDLEGRAQIIRMARPLGRAEFLGNLVRALPQGNAQP